jgi:hypothetical protein
MDYSGPVTDAVLKRGEEEEKEIKTQILARTPLPEREWAVGMTQEQLNTEWLKRFPFSDVIPDVKIWPYNRPVRENNFKPINPEDYQNDILPPKIEEKEERPEEKKGNGILYCRGCKREFKPGRGQKAGLLSHENACKEILHLRAEVKKTQYT